MTSVGRKRGLTARLERSRISASTSRSGHDDDARFGTFSLAFLFLFCSRGPFAVVFGVLNNNDYEKVRKWRNLYER